MRGDHAAAADRDRHQVGHPEVRPDAADLRRGARLAREAVDEHSDVGRCATDVGDERVVGAAQERRAPDRVGRTRPDRQHRIAQRVVERHQRAVVLGEERRRAQTERLQRPVERSGDVRRHAHERRVEHGRVLTLDQAEGSDLMAERDVDVVAEHPPRDLLGRELVALGHRREHARDRDAVDRPGKRLQEAGERVLVERDDLTAIELDPTGDHDLTGGHRLAQVGRPGEQRADGVRRRSADPHRRHAPQPLALDHRVRRVGGAEHHVGDPRAIDPRRLEHGLQRLGDPTGDVGSGQLLGLGEQLVVSVEDHGVGVRTTDVDADAKVLARVHRMSSSIGV